MKKKKIYPDRQHFNLLDGLRPEENKMLIITIFVIFMIALGFFTKLGVIDRLAKASEAVAAYNSLQAQIDDLRAANSDYNKVKENYSHFGMSYLTEEESVIVDRENILELLDLHVLPYADISSVDIMQNAVTLTVEKTKLNVISSIVKKLENDSEVAFVTVNVAGTEIAQSGGSNYVTATMYIEMVPNGGKKQ